MAQLRIKQTDDLELISELDCQLFEHEGLKGDDALLNDSVWWVAEAFMDDEWQPVGYAGLEVTDAGKKAFLSRAGVLPIARGQQLQQRLIRARVAYARRQGVERVWTYTHWANIRSQRSLVRAGLLPYYYERQADGDQGHIHFIYYELALTAKPKPLQTPPLEVSCSADSSTASRTTPSPSTASPT
jgi:RimJ/RimL family protein N-acetyltransferase